MFLEGSDFEGQSGPSDGSSWFGSCEVCNQGVYGTGFAGGAHDDGAVDASGSEARHGSEGR